MFLHYGITKPIASELTCLKTSANMQHAFVVTAEIVSAFLAISAALSLHALCEAVTRNLGGGCLCM
jgi:hypothetical protein